MLTEDKVKAALSKVMDPDLNVDIVTLGMISEIKIEGKKVGFTLTLTTPACPVKEKLEQECKDAVRSLEGVETIDMVSTASVAGQRKSELLVIASETNHCSHVR